MKIRKVIAREVIDSRGNPTVEVDVIFTGGVVGHAGDDWDGWRLLTKELGERVQLVGDDLFVTNPARHARGINEHVANAILVKVDRTAR